MTVGVLLALTGPVESELVRLLDTAGSGVRVVRRCADIPEVLAAAGAGLGEIAVVAADLPGVDRSVVVRLREAGTRTLLVTAPDDRARCAALGADAVQPLGAAPQLAEAVLALAGGAADGAVPPPPPPPPPADLDDDLADAEPQNIDAAPSDVTPTAAERPGRLIAVWGPHGAPGRTTVAVNLAAELAAPGARSLLVDADTEAPSVTQVLGILDDASAIASVARSARAGRLDADALVRSCPVVDGSMHVMTGLTRADRWREVPAAALDVVWEVARTVTPWTVVDTGATLEREVDGYGPRRHEATESALAAADVIVVVGSADPVGMRRLVLALADLKDSDVAPDAERLVVVNRVRGSAAGPSPRQAVQEALARFAGVDDAVLLPDDRSATDKAVMQGGTLAQVAPSSAVRQEIEQLALRLTGERPQGQRRRRRRTRV